MNHAETALSITRARKKKECNAEKSAAAEINAKPRTSTFFLVSPHSPPAKEVKKTKNVKNERRKKVRIQADGKISKRTIKK